jgi:hypothetical protein
MLEQLPETLIQKIARYAASNGHGHHPLFRNNLRAVSTYVRGAVEERPLHNKEPMDDIVKVERTRHFIYYGIDDVTYSYVNMNNNKKDIIVLFSKLNTDFSCDFNFNKTKYLPNTTTKERLSSAESFTIYITTDYNELSNAYLTNIAIVVTNDKLKNNIVKNIAAIYDQDDPNNPNKLRIDLKLEFEIVTSETTSISISNASSRASSNASSRASSKALTQVDSTAILTDILFHISKKKVRPLF